MSRKSTYSNIDMHQTGCKLKHMLETAGYTPRMIQDYLHLSSQIAVTIHYATHLQTYLLQQDGESRDEPQSTSVPDGACRDKCDP